jgi:hypothetical protein
MLSLIWFWTTGIQDPVWVQAVAAVALVVLTIVTLIILARYAWDTRTLARTSVEQINLTKQERDIRAMRDYHHAYDSFFKIQADLTLISRSLADGTFGTKYEGGTPPPIYPDNWPDIASALNQRLPSTVHPTIKLGIAMRQIDFAVVEFLRASNHDEKKEFDSNVRSAVTVATMESENLLKELMKAD